MSSIRGCLTLIVLMAIAGAFVAALYGFSKLMDAFPLLKGFVCLGASFAALVLCSAIVANWIRDET